MEERFLKLFSLQKNLYISGAPVIIKAGALLKDNRGGKIIAQLKFQNITEKSIKALTVEIQPKNIEGEDLLEKVSYQYLDIDIKRDDEFGQDVPIVLSDNLTRAYAVKVSKVLFSDNSSWENSDSNWQSIFAEVKKIENVLPNKELAEQYRAEYGNKSKNLMISEKDLWLCSCGAVNHLQEACCHRCGCEAEKQKNFSIEELEKNLSERKACAFDNRKRKLKIIFMAVVIVVLATAVILFGISSVKKNSNYENALAAYEAGEYSEAEELFGKLGNYKDSKERFDDSEIYVLYEKALECGANKGDYSKALQYLEEIKNEHSSNLAVQKYNDGYHEMALRACEFELPAKAEECITNIDIPDNYDDIEEIKSEIELLKIYVEAKNTDVLDSTSKAHVQGLLERLPENYRESNTIKARIEKFEENPQEVKGVVNVHNGGMTTATEKGDANKAEDFVDYLYISPDPIILRVGETVRVDMDAPEGVKIYCDLVDQENFEGNFGHAYGGEIHYYEFTGYEAGNGGDIYFVYWGPNGKYTSKTIHVSIIE